MGIKLRTHAAAIISLTMVAMVSKPALATKLDERPSAFSMVADAVLVRPVLLGTTVVGTALYVLTLPLTLVGGNADEAGHHFVVVPFKATFVRCLGCTGKHLNDPE